jgi:hypothetical protein
MSQENVELMRQALDACESRDFDRMPSVADPETTQVAALDLRTRRVKGSLLR